MNDFLKAAKASKNGDKDDDSGERYEKLKKEEAGTQDEDLAKKRFEELKEEAKQDYIEKQKEKERKEEEQEDEEEDEETFVTH